MLTREELKALESRSVEELTHKEPQLSLLQAPTGSGKASNGTKLDSLLQTTRRGGTMTAVVSLGLVAVSLAVLVAVVAGVVSQRRAELQRLEALSRSLQSVEDAARDLERWAQDFAQR